SVLAPAFGTSDEHDRSLPPCGRLRAMRATRIAAILAAALPAVLIPIATACRHNEPAIVATFDVQQLPPEPPAPPPEPEPPAGVPAAPPARPAAPDPSAILREINGRIGPVLFATNRWEISEEGRRAIEADAREMMGSGDWVATVEGHADERGSDEWNR